ncbi:hypothetical protein ACMYR3_16470 [Ampullimonas aquatilis]|uniref:hypothetical protein n=1 Tax=Ampullimonas aquatilis TaxID=1341549 RepID=UPI003C77A96E
MSIPIEIENVVEIINSAFAPLRCVAELWDYGFRIRFRVFDKDEPLLNVDEILKPQFSDHSRLCFIINEARSNLTSRGFNLTEWQFP